MLLMFGADANFGFTLLSQLRNIAFSCFPILCFSCRPWGLFVSFFLLGVGRGTSGGSRSFDICKIIKWEEKGFYVFLLIF